MDISASLGLLKNTNFAQLILHYAHYVVTSCVTSLVALKRINWNPNLAIVNKDAEHTHVEWKTTTVLYSYIHDALLPEVLFLKHKIIIQ